MRIYSHWCIWLFSIANTFEDEFRVETGNYLAWWSYKSFSFSLILLIMFREIHFAESFMLIKVDLFDLIHLVIRNSNAIRTWSHKAIVSQTTKWSCRIKLLNYDTIRQSIYLSKNIRATLHLKPMHRNAAKQLYKSKVDECEIADFSNHNHKIS